MLRSMILVTTLIVTALIAGCAATLATTTQPTPSPTSNASTTQTAAPSTATPSAIPSASPTPNATPTSTPSATPNYAKPLFALSASTIHGTPISAPTSRYPVMHFLAIAPATQDAKVGPLYFGINNPSLVPNTWLELWDATSAKSLGRVGYGVSSGWYFPPSIQAASEDIVPKGTMREYQLLADFSSMTASASMTFALLKLEASTDSMHVAVTRTIEPLKASIVLDPGGVYGLIKTGTQQAPVMRLKISAAGQAVPVYGLDFTLGGSSGVELTNPSLYQSGIRLGTGNMARQQDGPRTAQFGYGSQPMFTVSANTTVVIELRLDIGNSSAVSTGSLTPILSAAAGDGTDLLGTSKPLIGFIREIVD